MGNRKSYPGKFQVSYEVDNELLRRIRRHFPSLPTSDEAAWQRYFAFAVEAFKYGAEQQDCRSAELDKAGFQRSEELFYLQDSRSYVGNDVLWWAKEGKGYTTDLSKAETYSKAQAQAQHDCRMSDIPWPKDYIDAKTRPAVDVQYIKREQALAGTGIELRQPNRAKREPLQCCDCGLFVSKRQRFEGGCPRCGADNRT